jgi:hypothetical protein
LLRHVDHDGYRLLHFEAGEQAEQCRRFGRAVLNQQGESPVELRPERRVGLSFEPEKNTIELFGKPLCQPRLAAAQ